MIFIHSQSNNICRAEKFFSQEEKPKNTEKKNQSLDRLLKPFCCPFSGRIFGPDLLCSSLAYFARSDALER